LNKVSDASSAQVDVRVFPTPRQLTANYTVFYS
jgi:hypothetical protein